MDPTVSELQIALNLGRPAGGGECHWQQFAGIDWPAVVAMMRRTA